VNPLRKLAGQTAIYGLSSIIGRVLSYLLVPIYTRVFIPQEYGIANELYAYISLLLVVLTYGMETAFFRFSEMEQDKPKVYSTALISLVISTAVFIIIAIFSYVPLAGVLRYPDHPEYIIWFALIVAMDALTAIPFARLRAQNKPKRFATLKLLNIGFNVGLNLFFIVLCPYLRKHGLMVDMVDLVYNENIGVGYIFISNLVSSAFTILLLLPEYIKINYRFDVQLWKRMIVYALPLLVVGTAGIINETMDRVFLKYLLPEDIAMTQLGIYGACFKISIIMTIFIQAFRFAAEPFFFAQAKEQDARKIYADVMKYFVIICSFIFLVVMMYIDVVKYFVGKEYYDGLPVVPILLLASMFLGIYFNLSIWYKLNGQTKYGAIISVIGAIITIIINVICIPIFGFMGSAWSHFFTYFVMMVISFFLGQKHFRVPYKTGVIIGYILLSVALYLVSLLTGALVQQLQLVINTGLLLIFLIVVGYFEKDMLLRILKPHRKT
jgi:O-antigen/teichoic acid export membrane protein